MQRADRRGCVLQNDGSVAVGVPGILGVGVGPAAGPGNNVDVNIPGILGVEQVQVCFSAECCK